MKHYYSNEIVFRGHPDKVCDQISAAILAACMKQDKNTRAEINGKAVKDYTKSQMLTWYNKLWSDAAEYKMWGNGVALPCVRVPIHNMAKRGARTLGSLFDGSGGFPLAGVLEGITPLWASEIEPYPIAVTCERFHSIEVEQQEEEEAWMLQGTTRRWRSPQAIAERLRPGKTKPSSGQSS